jgi:hypothetical protein
MTNTDKGATRPPRRRKARMQRAFDGVVASYIHEISARTAELRSQAETSPAPAA